MPKSSDGKSDLQHSPFPTGLDLLPLSSSITDTTFTMASVFLEDTKHTCHHGFCTCIYLPLKLFFQILTCLIPSLSSDLCKKRHLSGEVFLNHSVNPSPNHHSLLLLPRQIKHMYLFGNPSGWFSVTQLCLTLCGPMVCSTPDLPVPHNLPKFAQVHVHCIGDAIHPSLPLTGISSSALNLSQHEGLFQ